MRTNPSTIRASYNVATSLALGNSGDRGWQAERQGESECESERGKGHVVAGAGANLSYLLLGYCGCLPRLCFLCVCVCVLLPRRGAGADIRHVVIVVVVVDFGNHNCNCSLPKFMKCAVVDDDFATCPASVSPACLPCLCIRLSVRPFVSLPVRRVCCI